MTYKSHIYTLTITSSIKNHTALVNTYILLPAQRNKGVPFYPLFNSKPQIAIPQLKNPCYMKLILILYI